MTISLVMIKHNDVNIMVVIKVLKIAYDYKDNYDNSLMM
jgi:hypothetical protein